MKGARPLPFFKNDDGAYLAYGAFFLATCLKGAQSGVLEEKGLGVGGWGGRKAMSDSILSQQQLLQHYQLCSFSSIFFSFLNLAEIIIVIIELVLKLLIFA
ncbi:hypothetical protein Pfo_031420 [Paulownia fortunei]|nr:hypothetical protein Pfo_031420 [Paulownia fortunei]